MKFTVAVPARLVVAFAGVWPFSPTFADSTVTSPTPGLTLSGRSYSVSGNLSASIDGQYNEDEEKIVNTALVVQSTTPTQEVTPAKPGIPGAVDLVVYDQKVKLTNTSWTDKGGFSVSLEHPSLLGTQEVLVSALVEIDLASHFAGGFYLNLHASGRYTPSPITPTINIGQGTATVSILPAGPSFFQVSGQAPSPMSSSASFSTAGLGFDAWSSIFIKDAGSYSFSIIALEGISLDLIQLSFSSFDRDFTESVVGSPTRRVLSSVPLPALPAVPEPESALLALLGMSVLARRMVRP